VNVAAEWLNGRWMFSDQDNGIGIRRNIRRPSLASSSDPTQTIGAQAPAWGSSSDSALSSATAAVFGSSPMPEKAVPSTSPSSNEPDAATSAPHVVLIEDNKTDVFLVREAIAAHNLHVSLDVIEDGERAILFVEGLDQETNAPPPRLFLLDLNLPRRSGCEVLARIRQSRKCAAVPVLIVTSSDLERTQTAQLGATGYFRKPAGYQAFLAIGKLIREFVAA
jgi:two-component system response regulator